MGFYDDYVAKTSGKEAARSQAIIPGGVGSAIQFWPPYPIFVNDSKGPYVWDMDGNRYIDYCMCYAAMVAGHADPVIAEAIAEQAKRGILYGLPGTSATDLAEEIQRRYPVIEMLRFTQSGVEATMYAVRLARAATKKYGVLKVEGAYHGASDILLVEPYVANFGMCMPDTGYLERIREITRTYNVVLIFDEVKVGVRIAPGGGAEVSGVTPDIVCFKGHRRWDAHGRLRRHIGFLRHDLPSW
jgi:glutamate-1-semialdehyde 2,1-aminomutase